MTQSAQDKSANAPEGAGEVTELKKYALIAGQRVALPVDARFYFQDKRGLWFWSSRKPRIRQGDWSANKEPVQIDTEEGHRRCLQTSLDNRHSSNWRATVMQAVDLDVEPLSSAPELDELLAAMGG